MIDQASPYLKSLLINKGTKHGIVKGMTVLVKIISLELLLKLII